MDPNDRYFNMLPSQWNRNFYQQNPQSMQQPMQQTMLMGQGEFNWQSPLSAGAAAWPSRPLTSSSASYSTPSPALSNASSESVSCTTA